MNPPFFETKWFCFITQQVLGFGLLRKRAEMCFAELKWDLPFWGRRHRKKRDLKDSQNVTFILIFLINKKNSKKRMKK
jgi:hypothetical protein